jgi:hypothetical protein
MKNVENYGKAGQATNANMAHALSILDTQDYKHTVSICNTYFFTTAQLVTRRRLKVRLYVLWLPCKFLTSRFVTSPLLLTLYTITAQNMRSWYVKELFNKGRNCSTDSSKRSTTASFYRSDVCQKVVTSVAWFRTTWWLTLSCEVQLTYFQQPNCFVVHTHTSWLWRRGGSLVHTDISKEISASIFRVAEVGLSRPSVIW